MPPRLDFGSGIRQHAQRRFDHAEIAQRLRGLERIRKEFSVVVNPGGPGAIEKVILQNVGPEVLHLTRRGEESMAPDMKMETLVFHSPGTTPHITLVGFQDSDTKPVTSQDVCGCQTGGAGAYHDNSATLHLI